MRLSMSRAESLTSNSGLRTPGWPTSASTAVPPRAGLGTVATGWQAARASAAATAAVTRRLRELMGLDVREDDGAHQERGGKDPGRPVDLPLQPAAGAVPPAPPIATPADGAAPTRGPRRLDEDAGGQQDRQHDLPYDHRVGDPPHSLPIRRL